MKNSHLDIEPAHCTGCYIEGCDYQLSEARQLVNVTVSSIAMILTHVSASFYFVRASKQKYIKITFCPDNQVFSGVVFTPVSQFR